jgi:hypothetical protein
MDLRIKLPDFEWGGRRGSVFTKGKVRGRHQADDKRDRTDHVMTVTKLLFMGNFYPSEFHQICECSNFNEIAQEDVRQDRESLGGILTGQNSRFIFRMVDP